MECPRGLPVGQCCAIQKTGAVFVQEINACRDAVKRVAISKGGGDLMAEKPDRSMVRKALWDLICQTAERLQQESRQPLSKAEALVATAEKYPTLYLSYTDAVTRGDPPSEVFPAEPVAKRAPSEREAVFATIMKRAAARAATTGTTTERAIDDVFAADPNLYQQYRDAKP